MNFTTGDWVCHPKFGDGQVSQDNGDKLIVRFVSAGEKTMLRESIPAAGAPPFSGFRFPSTKASGTKRYKVEMPKREPALEFGYLVKRFTDVFKKGFDDEAFWTHERDYKETAVLLLHDSLSMSHIDSLLSGSQFDEVCKRALKVLQHTNLVFPQEKIKFKAALDKADHQRLFAAGIRDLLYGGNEIEAKFVSFANVLWELETPRWTLATYYQFLQTRGELMFMKPSVTKRMSEAVGVALNYRSEPNWLTYSKLQELSNRIKEELHRHGLRPHSGIDVQGFIWTSIQIADGKYSTT